MAIQAQVVQAVPYSSGNDRVNPEECDYINTTLFPSIASAHNIGWLSNVPRRPNAELSDMTVLLSDLDQVVACTSAADKEVRREQTASSILTPWSPY